MGIQTDPALIADHPVHMKLFFDDGEEDGHYAEVFLHIDLPQGLCGLNEKDQEYRPDLIHWLSMPGIVNANPHRRMGPHFLQEQPISLPPQLRPWNVLRRLPES